MKRILIILIILFTFATSAFAEHRDIAFTIDNNYPVFTMITMDSIQSHNKSKIDYTFWVIEDNLSIINKFIMKMYVTEYLHQNVKFINVDTTKLDGGRNLFSEWTNITKIGLARIMIPELLPKDIHKVLYMDSDILVLTDLKELFDTDMGKYPVAMVLNLTQHYYPGLYKFKHGYYNSGIILMDLDKWRSQDLQNKCITYLKNHIDNFDSKSSKAKLKFEYVDQDLINIVLDGKIKKMPPKWNSQWNYYTLGCSDIIVHYIASSKPWKLVNSSQYIMAIYLDYWNKTPLVIYRPYYIWKSEQNPYNIMFCRKKYRFGKICEYMHKKYFFDIIKMK